MKTANRALLMLTLLPLLAMPSPAGDRATDTGRVEKAARADLAKFDQGDPGWKVRMEALVGLVKAGPAVVPVLVEALQKGPPATREFAAQALVFIAAPSSRPALVRALADPEPGVRVHAIKALTMFGPLDLTDHQRQVLEKDSHWMLRHYIGIALARDDRPNPAALRKALLEYDLAQMDTARLGRAAPDLWLADAGGQSYRLSQFRSQKTVVLEFHSGDG